MVTIFLPFISLWGFSKLTPLDLSEYFEPIRAFMAVLVTCKYKEEPIKNEGAKVVT